MITKLYQQYLVDYANMDAEHFINFEDYKVKAFDSYTIEKMDVAKILADAEETKKLHQASMKK